VYQSRGMFILIFYSPGNDLAVRARLSWEMVN